MLERCQDMSRVYSQEISVKMQAKIDALQGRNQSTGERAAGPRQGSAGRNTGFCKQLGMLLAREVRGWACQSLSAVGRLPRA